MINAKEELDVFMNRGWCSRIHVAAKIDDLLGKTIVEIDGAESESEAIVFLCDDGSKYMMYHEQDCCECVRVEDICGDVTRLLNTPITHAEEVSTETGDTDWGTCTWTFYHLATVKGYVTIRWLGESNGYYSERVDMVRLCGSRDENCRG